MCASNIIILCVYHMYDGMEEQPAGGGSGARRAAGAGAGGASYSG